ncbi:hypothetical protein HGRIS_011701 [Hohenbuehelia grisea]|uniref:Uncharacterized protein n=1 Tax=Hohenbuehelia grisea TaxID=104357 RepID=A0ABR3JXL8_9AGAR
MPPKHSSSSPRKRPVDRGSDADSLPASLASSPSKKKKTVDQNLDYVDGQSVLTPRNSKRSRRPTEKAQYMAEGEPNDAHIPESRSNAGDHADRSWEMPETLDDVFAQELLNPSNEDQEPVSDSEDAIEPHDSHSKTQTSRLKVESGQMRRAPPASSQTSENITGHGLSSTEIVDPVTPVKAKPVPVPRKKIALAAPIASSMPDPSYVELSDSDKDEDDDDDDAFVTVRHPVSGGGKSSAATTVKKRKPSSVPYKDPLDTDNDNDNGSQPVSSHLHAQKNNGASSNAASSSQKNKRSNVAVATPKEKVPGSSDVVEPGEHVYLDMPDLPVRKRMGEPVWHLNRDLNDRQLKAKAAKAKKMEKAADAEAVEKSRTANNSHDVSSVDATLKAIRDANTCRQLRWMDAVMLPYYRSDRLPRLLLTIVDYYPTGSPDKQFNYKDLIRISSILSTLSEDRVVLYLRGTNFAQHRFFVGPARIPPSILCMPPSRLGTIRVASGNMPAIFVVVGAVRHCNLVEPVHLQDNMRKEIGLFRVVALSGAVAGEDKFYGNFIQNYVLFTTKKDTQATKVASSGAGPSSSRSRGMFGSQSPSKASLSPRKACYADSSSMGDRDTPGRCMTGYPDVLSFTENVPIYDATGDKHLNLDPFNFCGDQFDRLEEYPIYSQRGQPVDLPRWQDTRNVETDEKVANFSIAAVGFTCQIWDMYKATDTPLSTPESQRTVNFFVQWVMALGHSSRQPEAAEIAEGLGRPDDPWHPSPELSALNNAEDEDFTFD